MTNFLEHVAGIQNEADDDILGYDFTDDTLVYDFDQIIKRSHTHTFNDTDLSEIIGHLWDFGYPEVYIAGGSVRRTLEGKIDLSETDIDFFFIDQQQYEATRRFIQAQDSCLDSETNDVVNFSVSIRMANKQPITNKTFKFQLIKNRYYRTVGDLLDSFDFTICQFATGRDRKLYVGPYSLWDLGRKKLAVNRITFPVSSMRRMIKYTTQGFTACNGCMQTILQTTVEQPHLLNTRFQYID